MSWERVCMPIQEGGLGIQSLTVRREALLAKHAARFILEPQSLWSSVMRARYGDWSSSSYVQSSRRHSFFWKEVCRYSSSIMENISWMIGDGSSIEVLQDTWLSDIPLSRWPSFYSTDVPTSMRVKELFSSDPSSWQGSVVSRFFGEELARRIMSIPLTLGISSDCRLWRRSCLPKAPMKDLVQIFRPQSLEPVDAMWIWKLPILPRIQLFIWKLLWERLPTCALLVRRGLPIQPICPVCGTEAETTVHAIFSCPRVIRIWQAVGYCYGLAHSDSLCSLFLDDLRKGPQLKCALWASTAYQIWLTRNQIIFTDESTSLLRIIRRIRSQASDCARSSLSGGFDSPGLWGSPAASAANRHTVFISWEPPPPGYVKINFDGSVRGRSAGSAYVIRGQEGNLLAAGGHGRLDLSVPMSELYAAWEGILCAVRSLHAHNLFIEGDSITVIRWLRRDHGSLAPAIPILQDIWTLLREAHDVQIRHTYREANSAADWVASSVAHHSGFWRWRHGDPYPFVFQQILYSDVLGLTRARVV